MPKYRLTDLSMKDVENGSVFELDKQFYPEHLLWTEGLWHELLRGSIIKTAVRHEGDETSMLGNIIVLVDEDRRTNGTSLCYLIYTLTVAKEHQRLGLALRLLYEVSKAIEMRQQVGIEREVTTLELSVEKENDAAYKLYRQCGFKEFEYADGYEDKIYMWQPINEFHENMAALCSKMRALEPPSYKPRPF